MSSESNAGGRLEADGVSQETAEIPDRRVVWLERIEWIVAILISALVLVLVIQRTLHAGPLWRDECDFLNLARLPTFSDMAQNLQFTAFPILFPTLVRVYTSLFGSTDFVLRCFGLLVGILFLCVAWFQTTILRRSVPVLLLSFIGLNVNFLTAGLWLRGYGLGSVSIVLAFALTARFVFQPSWPRLVAVFVACLVSMHTLYFNGVLVPAFVLAGAVVLIVRREWKWLLFLLGAAAVCGLTYIPYIWKLYSSTRHWAMVLQMPVSASALWEAFKAACGGPEFASEIIWRGVVLVCLVAAAWRLKVVWKTNAGERDRLLFGLLAIVLSLLTYSGFFLITQNPPVQRYFLALVCVIVAGVTLLAASITWHHWVFFGRAALMAAGVAMVFFTPLAQIKERQSNIDVIAQRVGRDAAPEDLIVVNPASHGISFSRYYHGQSRWMTVPDIEDHRFHRYDLLRQKMTEFFPLDSVERSVTDTLKSGHRVWIVGTVGRRSEGPAAILAPAPDPKYGWQSIAYIHVWSRQFGVFLRSHVSRTELLMKREKSVSQWENTQLTVCEGWK